MQHNVRHTDRKLDKDHAPSLRLVPAAVPAETDKIEGPFPGNVCGDCGSTVEVVAERTKREHIPPQRAR